MPQQPWTGFSKEEYERLKGLPLEKKEEGLNKTFYNYPDVAEGKYPVPVSPWPYGRPPTEVAPESRSKVNRFFQLFPGMQDTINKVTKTPKAERAADYQNLVGESPTWEGLPIMGEFNPDDNSIYLQGGTGRDKYDNEDTFAHEMAHVRGVNHPFSNIVGSMYQDYLKEIDKRKNYHKDINLPYEPQKKTPLPKGVKKFGDLQGLGDR